MDLLQEYEISRKLLQQKLERTEDEGDRVLLRSMLRDMDYSIRWQEAGYDPGPKAGIYSNNREFPFDANLIGITFAEQYAAGLPEERPDISQADQQRIYEALDHLKPRDREWYTMYYGRMATCGEIAEQTGAKRDTVKSSLQRTRKKIAAYLVQERERSAIH